MKSQLVFNVVELQVNEEDSYGESVELLEHVEAKYYHDNGWTSEEIEEEIRELFHRSCSCEHDCCAHWFGGARRMRKIGKWTWRVNVSYAMNV